MPMCCLVRGKKKKEKIGKALASKKRRKDATFAVRAWHAKKKKKEAKTLGGGAKKKTLAR